MSRVINTVVSTKSYSDVIFCLQLLSKTPLDLTRSIDNFGINHILCSSHTTRSGIVATRQLMSHCPGPTMKSVSATNSVLWRNGHGKAHLFSDMLF